MSRFAKRILAVKTNRSRGFTMDRRNFHSENVTLPENYAWLRLAVCAFSCHSTLIWITYATYGWECVRVCVCLFSKRRAIYRVRLFVEMFVCLYMKEQIVSGIKCGGFLVQGQLRFFFSHLLYLPKIATLPWKPLCDVYNVLLGNWITFVELFFC